MSRGTAGAGLILAGAGLVFVLAGGAGVFAGLAFGERIHALLPDEITADPAAIGGAALALGGALLLTGAVHLAVAAAARRGRWLVAAILLCAVMAALAVGWAATAVVSAAAGTGPVAGMLAVGIGLGLLALAYAWAAAAFLRARDGARGRN